MKEQERVERSAGLSVLAALLLVRVDGRDEAWAKAWSLCKRIERYMGEVAQEAVRRTARKGPRKLQQCQRGASCPHDNPSLLSTITVCAVAPLPSCAIALRHLIPH